MNGTDLTGQGMQEAYHNLEAIVMECTGGELTAMLQERLLAPLGSLCRAAIPPENEDIGTYCRLMEEKLDELERQMPKMEIECPSPWQEKSECDDLCEIQNPSEGEPPWNQSYRDDFQSNERTHHR